MSQPATASKKRALMPSTPLRSRLRGHGHSLDSIVRIGKAGVTAAITAHLTKALFDHELVKVKLEAECPDDRFTVADQLGEQPGVNVVQILGRTILLYKRHPQEPRFEGKRAVGGEGDGASVAKKSAKKPDKRADRRVEKQALRAGKTVVKSAPQRRR